PTIKTEPSDDYELAATGGPGSQGASPLLRPYHTQQLAMPDPGSCLGAAFPPCPQRGTAMPAAPSARPKLHDLSSAVYAKGTASPDHGHLGLVQPPGEGPSAQDVPRPPVAPTGLPEQRPQGLLQPQSCSPTHPSPTGHQQLRLPKVQRAASPSTRPPSLPEACEDGGPGLAPGPVTVKREPEELDQSYLDD
ncbi:nuclear factor of activated T-cells, cytoplasmic 1-like, partial [Tupaia chinensis]|uniref:nuclear factor of activated T-cells, cytoplasmic 1-like n=1 Tax=Tupaia chinensis TaxID=246437 RepID=UPI000703DFA6